MASKLLDNIAKTAADTGASLASVIKITLSSRCASKVPVAPRGSEMVILGNGPSLNDTIGNHRDFLKGKSLMAVNFAANTPLFVELKPEYYVLADGHFFLNREDVNVSRLWKNLQNADWQMVLFVPVKVDLKGINIPANIKICRYNLTPVEGWKWLCNAAYAKGLGMPRPRNVLIPSIMLALRMKFTTIYIAGADHSWTRTISVDDDNHVISVQPHYYEEPEEERKRVDKEYINYPLHQIMLSFHIAFRSYHQIKEFAASQGIDIVNITPGSFIDAFPRKKL